MRGNLIRQYNVPSPIRFGTPPSPTAIKRFVHYAPLTVDTFNCSTSYVSGLYKMTVQDNPLTYLNDDSLYGLDRSLWELELVNTRLTYVPSRAIRTLQKLKILNLSGTWGGALDRVDRSGCVRVTVDVVVVVGNQISEVKMGDWNGLGSTLKVLKLANNAITSLPYRAFDNLGYLENLDLSGNMISEIHINAFQDGPLTLYRLNLADNMLKHIPFMHLSSSAMRWVLETRVFNVMFPWSMLCCTPSAGLWSFFIFLLHGRPLGVEAESRRWESVLL